MGTIIQELALSIPGLSPIKASLVSSTVSTPLQILLAIPIKVSPSETLYLLVSYFCRNSSILLESISSDQDE